MEFTINNYIFITFSDNINNTKNIRILGTNKTNEYYIGSVTYDNLSSLYKNLDLYTLVINDGTMTLQYNDVLITLKYIDATCYDYKLAKSFHHINILQNNLQNITKKVADLNNLHSTEFINKVNNFINNQKNINSRILLFNNTAREAVNILHLLCFLTVFRYFIGKSNVIDLFLLLTILISILSSYQMYKKYKSLFNSGIKSNYNFKKCD